MQLFPGHLFLGQSTRENTLCNVFSLASRCAFERRHLHLSLYEQWHTMEQPTCHHQTSDYQDIPLVVTRKRCITSLSHTIKNSKSFHYFQNTAKPDGKTKTNSSISSNIKQLSCILIGCTFNGVGYLGFQLNN